MGVIPGKRNAADARQRHVRRWKGWNWPCKKWKKVQAAPRGQRGAVRAAGERRWNPEARLMKESNGGGPCHNVQISTDPAPGIIVAASVTQACNDQHEVVSAIEAVKRQTGQAPQHL